MGYREHADRKPAYEDAIVPQWDIENTPIVSQHVGCHFDSLMLMCCLSNASSGLVGVVVAIRRVQQASADTRRPSHKVRVPELRLVTTINLRVKTRQIGGSVGSPLLPDNVHPIVLVIMSHEWMDITQRACNISEKRNVNIGLVCVRSCL
jgi:hypothetical protein